MKKTVYVPVPVEDKPTYPGVLFKPVDFPDEEEANNKADEMGEREDGNRQKYIDGNYTEGFMDCFKWIIDKLTK